MPVHSKQLDEIASQKRKIISVAQKEASVLESARRRTLLRLGCKMHIEDNVPVKDILKWWPDIKRATFYKWIRDATWAIPEQDFGASKRHLPPLAEQMLAQFCVQSAELGNPVSKTLLKVLAYEICFDINGDYPPSSNMEGWFRGFMQRNNQLEDGETLKVRRKGEGLSAARARSLKPDKVSVFADKVINPFLKKCKDEGKPLTLGDIGNWDEFMFEVNSSIQKGKVVSPPGLLYTCTPNERDEHMTVLGGHVGEWATPILLVFKGTDLNAQWLEHVQDTNGYIIVGVSENGWISPELKKAWYLHTRNHPDCPKPDDSILWIVDGHDTNFDPDFGLALSRFHSNKARDDALVMPPAIDLAVAAAEVITTPIALGRGQRTCASRQQHQQVATEPAAEPALAPAAEVVKGDRLSIFPSHSTQGMQLFDAEGGPIQHCKHNLGPILSQQYGAKSAITKADLVYCLNLAYFGGTFQRMVGRAETVVEGVIPELLHRAMEKVGWTADPRTGEARYDPLAVMDERKFKPAGRYAGGLDLGPTLPEPHIENGPTRSSPTMFYTLDDARRSRIELIVAECLKTAFPQIVPQTQSKKLKVTRKNQHPDGCILKPEHFAEAKEAAQKEQAETAAKQQLAAATKAAGDKTAKDNIIKKLYSIINDPEAAVGSLTDRECRDVLRTMGLPFSAGVVSVKKTRILDGIPGYKAALEGTTELEEINSHAI